MLTGDTAGTIEASGRDVGVDENCAERLPTEKVRAIEKLVKDNWHAVMVGNGINDTSLQASYSRRIRTALTIVARSRESVVALAN